MIYWINIFSFLLLAEYHWKNNIQNKAEHIAKTCHQYPYISAWPSLIIKHIVKMDLGSVPNGFTDLA